MTSAGWLLPTVAFPAEMSQGSMLAKACAALPIPAVPRCLIYPRGDRTATSVDYLLIADVVRNTSTLSRGPFQMIDWGLLHEQAAVVPYQQAAWNRLQYDENSRCLALRPFWVREVVAWIGELGLVNSTSPLHKIVIYRATAQRAVVSAVVGDRMLHFKADTAQPFVDAEVTQLVAAVRPALTVPTRAFDSRRGWWLTDHVEGVPLRGDLWPAHIQTAEAWCDLQRSLQGHDQALESTGVTRLSREVLIAAAHRACDAVDAGRDDRQFTTTMNRVQRLLDVPTFRASPQGLLHFDAAGRNILWTPDGSVFLDLESACIGPVIICGELMGRRMKEELTLVQRAELSTRGATAALRHSDAPPLTHSPEHISALTDLCLLADHQRRQQAEAHIAIDESSLEYAWQRVSRDFLNRVNNWRI